MHTKQKPSFTFILEKSKSQSCVSRLVEIQVSFSALVLLSLLQLISLDYISKCSNSTTTMEVKLLW